ncbi:MAG: PAS domain S-box protein, partial [Proteobacteria bacterium]|nr:PAS domain S-box protein [Pseudomonadota bacterium]
PTDSEKAEVLRRLRPVMQRYHFADVFVVSTQKEVRLSIESKVALCPEHYSSIDVALAEHHPVWTSLHLSPELTFPHISLVTPLFSEHGENGPVGAIILVADAAQFLYPLIQSWPIPSKTAETLLVRKDGDDVLFLNELHHKKNTALTLRIPLSHADLPAAMAIKGVEGIVEGKDYRGVDVIAAILPVPESPWFMVSKIDKTEAFAEWRFRSVMITAFILSGLALVAAAAVVARQRNLKAHYRALYKSEADLSRTLKRQSITLKAIGDAVISTDAEGQIDLMNPVAETLTGWSQVEARGRKLQEVFSIVNESTREPVEDPVVKVLKEGTVVGLANHTILIARDGREIPIADSGSPIRDEEGRIIGVVLVFKDQSSERQYQDAILEREERYHLLADNTLDVIWTMNMDLEFTYVNPAIRQLTGHTAEEWTGTRLPEHCNEEAFSKMAEIISHEIAKGREHSGVVFETEMLRKDNSFISVEIHGQVIFDERGNPVMLQGTTRDISERKKAEKELKIQKDRLEYILEGTNVGTWEWNVQTGETVFNKRWADIIGYTLDEITPVSIDTWVKYVHPDDLEKNNKALEAHFSGESDYYEIECRMSHKDGRWVWILDRGKVISWTEDGKPLRMYGTHQDITYRKQAETELRRSEYLSNTVQRLSKTGVWEWDINAQKVFWTEELYRIHNMEPDSGGQDKVEESLSCYRSEDRPVILDAFRRCIEEGTPYKLEFPFTTAKGRRIWIETSAKRIEGENRRNLVVGYVMDISDRKKNEEALRREEEKYKLILQTAMDGFWLTDLQGQILEVNDSYCQMSGYSQKEILSMRISELEGNMGPDEVVSKPQEVLRQKQNRFDTKHRRKDGGLFDVEISAQYLPADNGKLVFFIRDITLLKKAEQEKEHLQTQLLQAQKMESVGRLAGGVAH